MKVFHGEHQCADGFFTDAYWRLHALTQVPEDDRAQRTERLEPRVVRPQGILSDRLADMAACDGDAWSRGRSAESVGSTVVHQHEWTPTGARR